MEASIQLKLILKASGWSQEELARRLGVTFVTLNTWVNERSQPRKKAAEDIQILYFEIVGREDVDITQLGLQKKVATKLTTTLGKITHDKEILDKLTLYLTYHTNTIEGSTMTLDDTKAVLFSHRTLRNRTQAEQAEARNHQAALLWLLGELEHKDFVITEELVRGLHLRLMNGIIDNAGQYRNHGVRIMGSRVTVANYAKIQDLISGLVKDLSQPQTDIIERLARTHATFEKIHPFSDGNGRVGRLIMLAQAIKANLVPPLILKERKYAYYKYLELGQTKDNMLPLEMFIAETIITTNDLLFSESLEAEK